jgi:hypothetical protein
MPESKLTVAGIKTQVKSRGHRDTRFQGLLMDIHGPVGPTRSLKDFAVHIGIVTIGILIALSLEGIRETVYVHRAVREARENFRVEISENQKNIRRELENAHAMRVQIQKIVADLAELRQHPDQFADRIAMIKPSFYFFSSSRWDSALSTGALSHMKVEEINRYAASNFLVHAYSSLEEQASPAWLSLEAFFAARPSLSQQDLASGIEKLLLFQGYVAAMIHVGEQLQAATDSGLAAQP